MFMIEAYSKISEFPIKIKTITITKLFSTYNYSIF